VSESTGGSGTPIIGGIVELAGGRVKWAGGFRRRSLASEQKESHGQPSITTMSLTEPFIDTELPCSQLVRRCPRSNGSRAWLSNLRDVLPIFNLQSTICNALMGVSQEQAARLAGIDRSYYGRIALSDRGRRGQLTLYGSIRGL
jgi:hypothetical protein